jgi:hypothetical protein
VILSIVLPTIDGRQHELVRTVAMYERLTPVEIEWIVETGHSTCGEAWNAGAKLATGELLHMGADDIEPESEAWLSAASAVLDQGGVPLGYVREDKVGRFGRDFCRVVICKREWWQDVLPILYYSDNQFDELMRTAGHMPTVAEGFDFYHRRSMVGRGGPGMTEAERIAHDNEEYQAWRASRYAWRHG